MDNLPAKCIHCKLPESPLFGCQNCYYAQNCDHKYCSDCLYKFYGEQLEFDFENSQKPYVCPKHRDICLCELCMDKGLFEKTKNSLEKYIDICSFKPEIQKPNLMIPHKISEKINTESRKNNTEMSEISEDENSASIGSEEQNSDFSENSSQNESSFIKKIPLKTIEMRTMQNPLIFALKDSKCDFNIRKTQSALEYNAFLINQFNSSKLCLSQGESEFSLISLYKNLHGLAQQADLAAKNEKIVNDKKIIEKNEECEKKKIGKGVKIDLKNMLILIDKDVLLY